MRKTYRRNNFKDLSRQIIIIGFILVISVILGTYLNKMWPSYQNKIVDNINPFIEYYNNSSINLKSTIITNLKSDTSFMFKIIILSLLVVTFPIAIIIFILKGVSIGYTINSIILTLKFKSIKMFFITFIKNIIILPGAIILLVISFNYFKDIINEIKKHKKDNIPFLLKRYLLNSIIVLAISLILQLLLNTISISIIKFLVR